jgi:isopenicillin-N epimerase
VTTLNSSLRDQFLLNPDVAFLNHGSFGACPRPVFEDYQRWQLELERQPIEFLGRRSDELLNHARAVLAEYVNAEVDSLVFVENATMGINTVAHSLNFEPGDEILATNHEYGAMDYTWQFICRKTGACYVRQPMPLPVTTAEAFVETFWQAVTPRTRVIFISHITSPTALIFPIAEICRRARNAGILTVIDGAHVPGQLPLDLTEIGADFYSGNCHKWLCAPKGSAFLHARPEHHALIDPVIISWGYVPDSTFVSRNQKQGTRDIAAYLSVPAAIEFQRANHWDEVRQRCHALASETRQRLLDLTGLTPPAPDSPEWFAQMFTAPLPPCNAEELKRRLYDEYLVEVPITTWNGSHFVRVSIQGYNTREDLDRLVEALVVLLPQVAE